MTIFTFFETFSFLIDILYKKLYKKSFLFLLLLFFYSTFTNTIISYLENRGLLKEDYFADIVIFDESKIIDKGTFIEPTQFPDGIDYVLVNGNFAVKEGKSTNQLAGKVIRIKK